MLAVVVGHVWPVQLGLRGGKGVATSLAALLVFDFRVALVYAPVFLAGYAVTRRSVVPGLLAFVVLPFAAFYFGHCGLELSGVALLAGIVLFAHRENLVEEFATTKPQPP